MLPFEFIGHLLSLDLQWFVELAMNNLLWLFIFIAAAFVYNNMKWSAKHFFVGFFYLWLLIYFVPMLGWIYLVGGFLFLNYVSRIVVLTFFGNIPALKDSYPAIMVIQFFAVLVYYNLFLV
ncbi:hypothetical protein KKG83_06875 [Candidatus Micrarchaeota archaeon]|nr:hypothetical protein [Candidatus Micrarchaeota archaeon]MBU2477167.1 hypothetical protein [Candidatus Micrarchaeota archaeon]